MEQIIEIYGKEIKTDKSKFISCSYKKQINEETAEFINVRLTKDCGYQAVKGLQKIKFDCKDANVKDGEFGKILYISKATGVDYTDEEKQAMKDKQAKKVADLFE